ncbi:hypothetical protein [Pseudoxanthomonas sp. SE1]|uniref:hypothetical protein n=1 Tax=Pseudoxanthomonas sp. SE1 TaxID=1664560 RepID=UPI00240D294A|nr:hypothetical protein [Pseudoxanthomonas sp. SE1]WFC40552.1 hypothetical protein OY559_12040 [Pseudoxanthomonas sp. SE1]
MPKTFVIEDESHAEHVGEFSTLQLAWAELRRLSEVPWDAQPNAAPCQSWRTCGRDYQIIEYDTSSVPWALVERYAGLQVSAKGVAWGPDAPHHVA